MNKIQKMMISLVKQSQQNDLKRKYVTLNFKEAIRGWRKELKEMEQYNISHIRRVRDYLKHENE